MRHPAESPAIAGMSHSKPALAAETVAATPLAGRPISGGHDASGSAPREQGLPATTMTALIVFPDTLIAGRSKPWPMECGVATVRGPAKRLVGVSASAMRKTISRNIMMPHHHGNAEI